jgi:hypothetical protein
LTLQYKAIQKFIGKPVKDIYRRYIGYVVGLTLDASGRLSSVGVDKGGIFEEFSGNQIIMEDDNLILIPSWKVEAEKFAKEHELTAKRFKALDELLKSHEIPSYVYEELYNQYKDTLGKLKDSKKCLLEKLTNRIKDLDSHIKHLERFLGYLKVQHKTGEISDEAYKVASDYLNSNISKTIQEKKDIESALNTISSLFENYEHEEVSEEQEPHPPETSQIETTFTSSEENEPLIVKVTPQNSEEQ